MSEAPTNTFAVLVMECEGKHVMPFPNNGLQCLTIPVPSMHMPRQEAIKALAQLLGANQQDLEARVEPGPVHQRLVPRVYYHPYHIELTLEEIQKINTSGQFMVWIKIPMEPMEGIVMVHFDMISCFRD